jgi:cytidylate kinase
VPTDFSEAPEFRGVVALDGPSGTGKSTVARLLARRLQAQYLDTGAMYRAATVAVLRAGIDPADPTAVAAEVAASRIDVGTDPWHRSTRLNGKDVEREIRTAATTAAVSAVSAVPAVRAQLVDQQRLIIGRAPTVAEGRDIGSVVWPDAELKVYLTASAAARAQRRSAEDATDVAATEADLNRRDKLDSSRAVDPLRQADDAVTLDTTGMGIDEVVATLLSMLNSKVSS